MLDTVPLEVDAPCPEFVDLLLVGDEHSRLRDDRDSQHCAEHKAAPRASERPVQASHIVPHAL
ncbi:hypothetical protein [Streptomyces carpinensis]|uniref:Uncharacterized protein n=1 Tax=Streptomyces carpinensis TaxID=66369 RepID=A0ABV1VZK6_9ACTN|nr:hypothetical protein [Streptomyces carpinensis]